MKCITCGKSTKQFVSFPCPTCANSIVRCSFCRENRNPYKCSCGFVGP